MNISNTKGKELEDAVMFIEKAILHKKLNTNCHINIEPRKILFIDEVRYEIDLYVELDLGIGHKHVYIFECKNWKKKVSVEQISYFSEKIRKTNAEKGYFVVKNISKYALKKAQEDKRIEILKANDYFDSLFNFPEVHYTYLDRKNWKKDILIEYWHDPNKHNVKVEFLLPDADIIYNGIQQKIKDFLVQYVEMTVNEKTKTLPTHFMEEGNYPLNSKKIFEFQKDHLIIEGDSVSKIEITIDFELSVLKPKILKYSIENKGRFLGFTKKLPNGTELNFNVVDLY